MSNKLVQKKAVQKKNPLQMRDVGVIGAFVGAIAILLLVASYVIYRLSSERVYKEKWKDYNDCGWA